MTVIILTFTIAILSISWIIIKDSFSRLIIFTFLSYWLLSMSISSINPYDLYCVSPKTYTLLMLHLVFFLLGFSSIKIKKNVAYVKSTMENDIIHLFRNKIFIAVLLISIILAISTLRHQYLILATNMYNSGNIKVDILELLFSGNRLKYYYYSIVGSSLEVILFSTISFLLIYKRSFTKIIFVILLFLVPMALIGGGRNSIMMIIYYLLAAFYSCNLQNNNLKVSKFFSTRVVIIGSILLLLVFVTMTYVTFLGGGYGDTFNINSFKETSNALLKQFVTYSIGPFRAFDISIHNQDYYYSSMPFFGRATFGGLDYLFNLVASMLGIRYNPANAETVNILQGTTISIGPANEFNYAYTILFYFIQDMGIIGIAFFPFFFGAIIRYFIYSYTYRARTLGMFCAISFSFFGMIHSLFANVLTKPYAIIVIIFLLLYDKYSRHKIL